MNLGLYWMLTFDPHRYLVGVGNYYHFINEESEAPA